MYSRSAPRRRHGAEFKARVLAACDEPGASISGVALAHGLNANLVRQWRAGRGVKLAGVMVTAVARGKAAKPPVPSTTSPLHGATPEFVAIEISAPAKARGSPPVRPARRRAPAHFHPRRSAPQSAAPERTRHRARSRRSAATGTHPAGVGLFQAGRRQPSRAWCRRCRSSPGSRPAGEWRQAGAAGERCQEHEGRREAGKAESAHAEISAGEREGARGGVRRPPASRGTGSWCRVGGRVRVSGVKEANELIAKIGAEKMSTRP